MSPDDHRTITRPAAGHAGLRPRDSRRTRDGSGLPARRGPQHRTHGRTPRSLTQATCLDRSTYREPSLAPVSIQHVIVNGVSVVANGQAVEGVAPGKPVRAP